MNDLSKYIAWIEVQTFFSGFIFLYAAIYLLSSISELIRNKLFPLLPYTYAFTGLLFAGMQVDNYITNLRFGNNIFFYEMPLMQVLALSALLFFIPAISKIKYLCLVHSLVFFLMLLQNSYFNSSGFDSNNNIKIFSVSILLNLSSLFILVLVIGISRLVKSYFINRKENDKVQFIK